MPRVRGRPAPKYAVLRGRSLDCKAKDGNQRYPLARGKVSSK